MAKNAKAASAPTLPPPPVVPEPEAAESDGWQPHFHFDLKGGHAKDFNALVDSFDEWRKTLPDEKVDLPDGWHTIDQELAERLLVRNGGNRWPSLATVVYYSEQMAANDWQKTGETIILDVDGLVKNGQHRLWASYLGGYSFPIYIVNQTERIESDFAYIDSGKPRTAKDALATAGYNGRSPVLAGAVKLARHYEAGAFLATKKRKLPRMSNPQVIRYVDQHPELRRGVNLMSESGQHADAAAVIGRKDVAGYVAAAVIKLHDEYVLAEFMDELGSPQEEMEEGSAVAALAVALDDDRDAVEKGKDIAMEPHQVLGVIIKAFNAWLMQEPTKKIGFGTRVNEPFPRFLSKEEVAAEKAEPQAEAAE